MQSIRLEIYLRDGKLEIIWTETANGLAFLAPRPAVAVYFLEKSVAFRATENSVGGIHSAMARRPPLPVAAYFCSLNNIWIANI